MASVMFFYVFILVWNQPLFEIGPKDLYSNASAEVLIFEVPQDSYFILLLQTGDFLNLSIIQ